MSAVLYPIGAEIRWRICRPMVSEVAIRTMVMTFWIVISTLL